MITSSNSAALPASTSRNSVTGAYRRSLSSHTTAMCMAVGKVSLDDCPRFTWSLGCTGFFVPRSPPASSIARFEMTSLEFMFDCVPDPVWNTTSGKWSSSFPAITSSAARTIRSAKSDGSSPSSALAWAAAFFSTPNARIIGRPQTKVSRPMSKLPRLRWVCAPQ